MIIHYKNSIVFLDKVIHIDFDNYEGKVLITFLYEVDWQNSIKIKTNIPYEDVKALKGCIVDDINFEKDEIDLLQLEEEIFEKNEEDKKEEEEERRKNENQTKH